jgi:hypothetical protein
MRPALISFRITTSRRGLAEAPDSTLVYPHSSIVRALRMVARTCSSGGRRVNSAFDTASA